MVEINMRFTVIDEFGDPIRKLRTLAEAKKFIRNKKGCTIHEISLFEILGECLI